MKRTVFIVEGHTEQIFVRKFLEKAAAITGYHLSLENLHNGKLSILRSEGVPIDQCSHYIRVINVENDGKVNSFIKDNLKNFKSKDVGFVYGVRDRYTGDKNKPTVNPEAINKFLEPMANELNITLKIIVAIEEIEAWFLSVPDFFTAYDRLLTVEAIKLAHGIDLSSTCVESIPHPAALIDKVLFSVGKEYKKRQGDSHKITSVLDYDALYLEKSKSIPALGLFVNAIDNSLN
jgi:hypothetical protein